MLWRGWATSTVPYKVLIALFIVWSVTKNHVPVYQVASVIAGFILGGLINSFKNIRQEERVYHAFTCFLSIIKYPFPTFRLNCFSKCFMCSIYLHWRLNTFQQATVIASFSVWVQMTKLLFVKCMIILHLASAF